MKFSEDHTINLYKITGYEDTSVRVNDRTIDSGFIITPSQFIGDWQPNAYEDLLSNHLDTLFSLKPAVILIGTGNKQIFPPKDVYQTLINTGVGFEIMDTQAACRTFNVLMSEDRNVAAAIFTH